MRLGRERRGGVGTGWLAAGLGLLAWSLATALLSTRFEYGGAPGSRPTAAFVGLMMIAGAVHVAVVWLGERPVSDRRGLAWVVFVGAAMRLCMLLSTPILEDDYYRYLWDGAVTAAGANPYRYAPREVAQAARGVAGAPFPEHLADLAERGKEVLARVNHPELTTIYPPVAQLAFAAAHVLTPFELAGWRLVLLCGEGATLALLLLLVRRHGGARVHLVAAYWWSPLAVKEGINSAHVDVLTVPLVLLGFFLTVQGRGIPAAAVTSLGAGVKLWPALLLVAHWHWTGRGLRWLPTFATASCGTLALVLGPFVLASMSAKAGLVAYGTRWEMNDGLFTVLVRGMALLRAAGVAVPLTDGGAARMAVALIALAVLLWLFRKRLREAGDLFDRAALAVAWLLLLSPTQFPWYALWFLPLTSLRPRLSLQLLAALLPLYYLRFQLKARGDVATFDDWLVWLETAPVIGAMVVERWRGRVYRARALVHVGEAK
ncbi:MAG: DUF2029 domain-containing protein [Candidatus Schekmanbacteria bacterium]|nr:DUF2029 domain-containing protein [Candidatus Schekmanbacteria bacterium]